MHEYHHGSGRAALGEGLEHARHLFETATAPPNSWGTNNPKTPDFPSSTIACHGNLRERSVSSALEARTSLAMRLLSAKTWVALVD